MNTVIAIDPGRDKTGMAVVTAPDHLEERRLVIGRSALPDAVELIRRYRVGCIVVGDGTGSRRWQEVLQDIDEVRRGEIAIAVVDERHTTEMAIRRYWRLYPPHGWRRWIPRGWQAPPVPVDDLAAWILAEIYFGKDRPEALPYERRLS